MKEEYVVAFPIRLAPGTLGLFTGNVEEEIARRVAGLVEHEIWRNQAQDLIDFERASVTVTKVSGDETTATDDTERYRYPLPPTSVDTRPDVVYNRPLFQEPVREQVAPTLPPKRKFLERVFSGKK